VESKTSWFITYAYATIIIMATFYDDEEDNEEVGHPKYWSKLEDKICYGTVSFFWFYRHIINSHSRNLTMVNLFRLNQYSGPTAGYFRTMTI
jgi:hypothetical protein